MGDGRAVGETRDAVLGVFGDVPLELHTVPFAVFRSLGEIIKPDWGFLFADIGGEVSDVSLVREGVLRETVSFPVGKNAAVRKLASSGVSPEEARSMLKRLSLGHASSADAAKAGPAAADAAREWGERLKEAAAELSDNGPLPRDFFLVGGTENGPFAERARDGFFSRFTVLGKPFNVKPVSPAALKERFGRSGSFEKEGDAFLMLEALFARAGKKSHG